MENSDMTDCLNQHTDEYRYLLLDPLKKVASANLLSLQKLQQNLGRKAIHPVLRADLSYTPAHCPQLVLLARPGEPCEFPWLIRAKDYARGERLQEKRYLCGWLSSTEEPESLAFSLAEQCNSMSYAFLPFFEPLRFELLHVMSPKDGLAGSIWPVNHWWYMSVEGVPTCQAGKASADKWRMNWGAEWAQQNARAIGHVLKVWGAVNPILPAGAVLQAAAMWKQIAEIGLSDTRDSYFLAAYNLGLGVDITQHPAVKNLIQQVMADPSMRLSRCLKGLPETTKQEVKPLTLTRQEKCKGVHRHGI